jgi:hypothetical protein
MNIHLEFAPDAEAWTVFVLNIKVNRVIIYQLFNIQVAICIENHQTQTDGEV